MFVLLLVYVDDIVITCTSTNLVSDIIDYINVQFKLKDLDSLNYFIGMEVTYGDDFILLNQKKYVQELLEKVGIAYQYNFPTLMNDTCLTRTAIVNFS